MVLFCSFRQWEVYCHFYKAFRTHCLNWDVIILSAGNISDFFINHNEETIDWFNTNRNLNIVVLHLRWGFWGYTRKSDNTDAKANAVFNTIKYSAFMNFFFLSNPLKFAYWKIVFSPSDINNYPTECSSGVVTLFQPMHWSLQPIIKKKEKKNTRQNKQTKKQQLELKRFVRRKICLLERFVCSKKCETHDKVILKFEVFLRDICTITALWHDFIQLDPFICCTQ